MDDAIHARDGFTIKFKVGNFKSLAQFTDGPIDGVVSNIALFLLGCGFSRAAIVTGFRQAADSLESPD